MKKKITTEKEYEEINGNCPHCGSEEVESFLEEDGETISKFRRGG